MVHIVCYYYWDVYRDGYLLISIKKEDESYIEFDQLLFNIFECYPILFSWNLVSDLQYAIKVDGKMELESLSNYDEVKNAILEKVMINLFS